MFARFRNIFSKSKPDAMTEEENDVFRENGAAKLPSQSENTALGGDNTKDGGNITKEDTKDTKGLSVGATNGGVDVPEVKTNGDTAAEVGKTSMQLSQESGNITRENTKELSEEITKSTKTMPEQTAKSESEAKLEQNSMQRLQELVKDGNITTERNGDGEPAKGLNVLARSSKFTIGISKDTLATPVQASEQTLENNILENVKDTKVVSEETLETNKSVKVVSDAESLPTAITETEKTDAPTVLSKDMGSHVATDTTKSADITPSATYQKPNTATQHADESKRNENVASDTNAEQTDNVAALKVDGTKEEAANTPEVTKNTTENQTNIGKNAPSETEIGKSAANSADTSGVENVVRVGNEVSSETSATSNVTPKVSAAANSAFLSGENAVEGSEKRNAPNTFSVPTAPAPRNHLQNANENAFNNSSVVVDDLVTDVSSPVSVGTQLSAQGDATADGQTEAGTIVVNPTGDNDIACAAISNKLKEISEVAESLDATIRDVQNDTEVLETTSGVAEKKRENPRSNSSEDWHSRSTEDESFATASEGNFTPHSHSSSFQTASGRSFDTSEADDEAAATSSINMSFDGSEHSFLSALQPTPSSGSPLQQRDVDVDDDVRLPGDSGSMTDAEELRSQSVTPTPDATHYRSIPVESETELEAAYIAESPPMEMLTELTPMTSVTPEVSTCMPHSTNSHNSSSGGSGRGPKPNAAWRRSKYYENITKQTIKGFL